MWKLTFERKVKNKWNCKKYVFPFVKKMTALVFLRPNLNFDCIVAKEGRDVISVTLHFGQWSDFVSRKKSGINMKDPKFL